MKKLLFFLFLFFSVHNCYCQAYIPMPTDAAVWRYRIVDADYLVQVLDNILFLSGQDTAANGNTYHKIISRTCKQTGPIGFNPPIASVDANGPDLYYGAMREEGRKVFLLAGAGEQLMFDFTVAVGDSIPAYAGKDKVTAIDSVLLNDGYHKRFLTNDPTYFVIEGVGSNRGLIPTLNDGGSDMFFICLTDSVLSYLPDSALPCTYVFPAGYVSAVSVATQQPAEIKVFPVPAKDIVHVVAPGEHDMQAMLTNEVGQVLWIQTIDESADIDTHSWSRGVYYIRFAGTKSGQLVRKILIN